MDQKLSAIGLILLGALFVGVSMSTFIVDQRQQAIVLQLGQPIGDIKPPGLHFKIPFIQDVRYFDSRILSVDGAPEQVVISSSDVGGVGRRSRADDGGENDGESAPPLKEGVSAEPIIVDTFARYRIVDPLSFLRSLRNVTAANDRIQTITNEATRSVLGKATLREILSEERRRIMAEIRDRVNAKVSQDNLGIEIVDIRIVRADLTQQLRQSTVRRMRSELLERATEIRAEGEKTALEVRSKADKQKAIILAEAERDAQILRGEGDREAIRIYADAYKKDAGFYDFSRSLEAYGNTLASPDTRLILSPRSRFFRHFGTEEAETGE